LSANQVSGRHLDEHGCHQLIFQERKIPILLVIFFQTNHDKFNKSKHKIEKKAIKK
jgi:hypothetical protein